ncbi:MAG: hypothetical protein C4534_03180 [Gaiellales bacterium]|nr:MAG: hypothetical protein C4534_03180 [Gaiellales bacterium]
MFLLAAALRTIAALSRPILGMDEVSLISMADKLLLGVSPTEITGTSPTAYGILYPLVTSFFGIMTRDLVVAGYITSVLFGSLMILPPYLFGKVMWNRKVGYSAAALVAVLPVLVDNGGLAGQQSIFAFWLGCGMFFGYRMQFTKRCLCGMLSGTCLGMAYLVDTSALYFVIILFAMLVIIGLRQELASYATKAAVQFLVTFLVIAAPNVAWMTYNNGSFTVFNRTPENLQLAVDGLEPGTLEYEEAVYGLDGGGEVKLYALQEDDGFWATLVSRPWQLLKAVARADFDFYLRNAQSLVPVWLLPMFGLGLFGAVWTRREALRYGFFLVMLLPALVMPVLWPDGAFVLPFVVLLMVVTGKGWAYLEDWSAESADELAGWQKADPRHKAAVARALAAVVLVPLAALSMWTVFRADHPTEFREAGEWLGDNGGEGALVMSREPATAWYAEGKQVLLPYASVDEVVQYGRENEAGYLVVSRGLVDDLRPQLAALLDGSAPPGLEEVYRSGEGTGSELVVYRIR